MVVVVVVLLVCFYFRLDRLSFKAYMITTSFIEFRFCEFVMTMTNINVAVAVVVVAALQYVLLLPMSLLFSLSLSIFICMYQSISFPPFFVHFQLNRGHRIYIISI